MLNRRHIYPNAYYNYRKQRKAEYHIRPKKPKQEQGKAHKVFANKLNQEFTAEKPNQKWCTDFTYLFLKNGEVRYNCSILDLYDRSIIEVSLQALRIEPLPVNLRFVPYKKQWILKK